MFKDMRTKFETEVEKIKKEHPQETAKIKEYQKKIEDMYNKVSADTQKVIEKVTKDTEGNNIFLRLMGIGISIS